MSRASTTTTTTTTGATSFITQSHSQSVNRASFPEPGSGPAVDPPSYSYPSRGAHSVIIDLPIPSSSSTIPSTPIRSSTPVNHTHEMSKHSIAHDEWAGPIPSSTMRNSMSLHRPAFIHTSTNYHSQSSLNTSASASASTSSLPLQQATTPATSYQTQHQGQGPYRDHPLTTKEEYPNSDPTTNPYAQAFPARTHTPTSRRHAPPTHSRQSSFGAWESVCCRLADARRRMCCKEGALGRALMIGWVMTTVGFLLACAFWKGELFTGKSSLPF